MTLAIYTELKNEINTRLDVVNERVQSFSVGGGLVQMSEEFRAAKTSFDLVFRELQILNKHTSNKIKREYSKAKRNY